MAVYAAHLTRTLQEKPSIFEVTAQESLASMVNPAFRRVIEFLTSINKKKFGWILKWYEEIFLVFHGVLQYNYIRNYAASFAETFYGLHRICPNMQKFTDGFHLSPKQEKLSLFYLVFFPYIRQYLNQIAEQYRMDEADGLLFKDWRGILQKIYTRVHATLHFCLETLGMLQNLAYMAGKTNSHSPILSLCSLTLRYVPDIIDEHNDTWYDFWKCITQGDITSASITFRMVGTAILRGMEMGAFFIQFLKWFETQGPNTNSVLANIPEPPKMDIKASRYINKCPICLQSWRIPTAIPVSGYVFCYKCILRHLKDDKRCPVTKYPAEIDDLIRIYL